MRQRRSRLVPPLRLARVCTAALLACVLAGCGGGDDEQTLTVLAAASLTETFDELASSFEGTHDGVDVVLAYDSSATLATQVAGGAPGDVLATADTRTMRAVTDAGVTLAEPVTFATNSLVLVVPAGNPAGVRDLADLDRPDVSYVVCVESAPCGDLARGLLDDQGVSAPPRSLEVDVKAVLSKVLLDEADAGLVYATDARSAGDGVETLAVPGAEERVTSYQVAVLEQSREPELAREWVELLSSEEGRAVLADAGFGRPAP